jgi:hypothetical protein
VLHRFDLQFVQRFSTLNKCLQVLYRLFCFDHIVSRAVIFSWSSQISFQVSTSFISLERFFFSFTNFLSTSACAFFSIPNCSVKSLNSCLNCLTLCLVSRASPLHPLSKFACLALCPLPSNQAVAYAPQSSLSTPFWTPLPVSSLYYRPLLPSLYVSSPTVVTRVLSVSIPT